MSRDPRPLFAEELERLRADCDRLPAHAPQRRLLATLDQTRLELELLRRLLRERPPTT